MVPRGFDIAQRLLLENPGFGCLKYVSMVIERFCKKLWFTPWYGDRRVRALVKLRMIIREGLSSFIQGWRWTKREGKERFGMWKMAGGVTGCVLLAEEKAKRRKDGKKRGEKSGCWWFAGDCWWWLRPSFSRVEHVSTLDLNSVV
jgi:hypothetical protein